MKLKQLIRIILEVLLMLVFIAALVYNELVVYGISQGKGQLKIITGAKDIKKVITDTSVPDSIKTKLLFIEKIRRFAFDSLGINENENYTTYYEQHGKPVLWVITASERFRMKAYEWRFPVVGKVSYKGFFEKERAIIEQAKLAAKGYDTELSTVSGWSTLGFFRDPVLSQMLRNSEGGLAELIIHELTHGTLYVKSNVTFNENLATFIGERGAEKYLAEVYGECSVEMKRYLQEKKDDKDFSLFALYFSGKLKQLYRSQKDTAVLERRKAQILKEFVSFVRSSAIKDERYLRAADKALKGGNAFFMGFERYDSRLGDFQEQLDRDHHGNLRSFLTFLKTKYGKE